MPSVNKTINELVPLLKPGTRLSLTIEFTIQDQFTFATSLVGHKEGQYIILELPSKAKEALVMRNVSNAHVVVRCVTDTTLGHVIAFKSTVLQIVNSPVQLIFIRFPKHFASKPIRNHERYSFEIPIEISSNTITYQATMLDFSLSGLAFFVLGECNLSRNSLIDIHSPFSEFLPDKLGYSIVSITKEKNGHRYGVKYDQALKMNDRLKLALLEHNYLSSSL
ncbi:flagellar brake protein [Vibrio sonorensis]|uniref:flagellar brake protein n=1 Tax=Vibrio sonorensis TaxID=1004316 RepID=UPI0008DA2BE2|nr:flagellar brake protein [Vibrio sonorensis]